MKTLNINYSILRTIEIEDDEDEDEAVRALAEGEFIDFDDVSWSLVK